MWRARRSGSSDMSLPRDRLLRHVTDPPTPLQRHVPPGGRASATCDGPAGPAPATCASRGIGYCDMWLASRPRSSDMCLPWDPLLRHVTGQPALLQRHVGARQRNAGQSSRWGPPTGIAAAGRDTPAPSRKPETKTTKRRTRAVVAAPFPLARAPCGGRKLWSFARCAGDAGRRPALHCRARFGRIAFSRQLARRAGRSLTRRNGYKHRTGSSDMCLVGVRRLA